MAITRVLTIITLALLVSGTVHAEPALALRTTAPAHPLRDAIVRQHELLRPASSRTRAASASRHSSTATKVTAGFALGFAGFLVGSVTAFLTRYAAHSPGDGKAAALTGGMIGAGAGAALGVWLASR